MANPTDLVQSLADVVSSNSDLLQGFSENPLDAVTQAAEIGGIDLAGADVSGLADAVSPLVSGEGFDFGSIAQVAGDVLSGSAAEQVEAATSNLGGLGDIVGSIGGFAASLFGKE